MKRRYKLLIIVLVGAFLTILINNVNTKSKINLTSLGDGFSLGMTPYNVAGTSFNDYLKEKLENRGKLDKYNNEFSQNQLTVHTLKEYLEKNTRGPYTGKPIKQTIASSTILTISIGIDEFSTKSLTENINTSHIEEYIEEMNTILQTIREFYDKKIIVTGLYSANNFKKNEAIELNNRLKKLCGKYNVSFLDILAISLNDTYYLSPESYYLNYQAHQLISSLIYKEIKNYL